MKNRISLVVFSLSILFVSCSKSNSSDSKVASVTFTANGVPYSMFEAEIGKETLGNETTYYLGVSDVHTNHIYFQINTVAIIPGSYSANTAECGFDQVLYGSYSGSDTIVITKIHNGFADGTFTAKARMDSSLTDSAMMIITNGVFKNVFYQK